MADTVTSNYNLTKPEINGSRSTWGTKINGNMDTIDSQMKANANAAAAAQTTANAALPKAGGTMTGYLTLNGTPTADLHAATKKYTDDKFVPLAGGTMTGLLTLSAAPSADNEAATKKYVDDKVANSTAGVASIKLPDGTTNTGAVEITLAKLKAAAESHTHAVSNLTQSGASNGQVIAWNGISWAAASLPAASVDGKAISPSSVTITAGNNYGYGGGPYSRASGGEIQFWAGSSGNIRYNFQTDSNIVVYNSSGTVIWSSQFGASSDARLKENVTNNTDALDKLKGLRVVNYTWRADSGNADGGKVHVGFIAQEVEPVIPDAANVVSGTYLVSNEKLVPYLVKAVQDLAAEVEALKARLGA